MGEFQTSPEEYFESFKQILIDKYQLKDVDVKAAEKRFIELTKVEQTLEDAEQKLLDEMEQGVSSITEKEGWVQKVNPDAGDIYKTPEKPDTE